VFHDVPPLRRLGLMQRLRRGRHHGSPGVDAAGGRSFALRFPSPPAYEIDGEWMQAQSAELRIQILPAALRVLAPAES
jgi:diacylglycerol kinase family enzyme